MAVMVKRNVTQQSLCLSASQNEAVHGLGIGSGVELMFHQDIRPSHPSMYRTADSVARRLFKRSIHCHREPSDDALFASHMVNVENTNPANTMRFSRTSLFLSPLDRARIFCSARIDAVCAGNTKQDAAMAALVKDRTTLLASLNSCRRLAQKAPLVLDGDRSDYIQTYADILSAQEDNGLTTQNESLGSRPRRDYKSQRTSLVQQSNTIRFCSPPRIGALAVAEMWMSGKYRGHFTPVVDLTPTPPSSRAERHLELNPPANPGTAEISIKASGRTCRRVDCDCHLRHVYEVLTSEQWTRIGIGKSTDHRWIVEVAEGDSTRDSFALLAVDPQTGDKLGTNYA